MVTRKCKDCNHFNPSSYDDLGMCSLLAFRVWSESVACKRFDDTVIFFKPQRCAQIDSMTAPGHHVSRDGVVGKGRYSNTAPRFPFPISIISLTVREITLNFLAECAGVRPRVCAFARRASKS